MYDICSIDISFLEINVTPIIFFVGSESNGNYYICAYFLNPRGTNLAQDYYD